MRKTQLPWRFPGETNAIRIPAITQKATIRDGGANSIG